MGRRRPLCSFQREQGHRRWHGASWMQWKSQQFWRSLARPRLRLRSRRRRRAKAQPAITVEKTPTAATRRDTATAAHAAHGDTSGEARAGIAWSRHASLKQGQDVLAPLIVIDSQVRTWLTSYLCNGSVALAPVLKGLEQLSPCFVQSSCRMRRRVGRCSPGRCRPSNRKRPPSNPAANLTHDRVRS